MANNLVAAAALACAYAVGSFIGNFLVGFFNAEALGLRLADWLRNKLKK